LLPPIVLVDGKYACMLRSFVVPCSLIEAHPK
jgi:hypothetical protein